MYILLSEKAISLGRDAVVGDYTTIMAICNLAGGNRIGKYNYLGMNCTIIEEVNTADHCTFEFCSCLEEDAVVAGLYDGIPAKLVGPAE